MFESYDHIEEISNGIETSSLGCSRSMDSLSSLESAYLDEVKDYPDAYASRLKELGIIDNIEFHDSCCRDGKFDNSNDTYSVDCTSNELEENIDYESGTPLNSDRGQWDGDRGNSSFVFNPEAKPSSKNYGNLKDQTYAEMGEELGDSSPQVFAQHERTLTGASPQTALIVGRLQPKARVSIVRWNLKEAGGKRLAR